MVWQDIFIIEYKQLDIMEVSSVCNNIQHWKLALLISNLSVS